MRFETITVKSACDWPASRAQKKKAMKRILFRDKAIEEMICNLHKIMIKSSFALVKSN